MARVRISRAVGISAILSFIVLTGHAEEVKDSAATAKDIASAWKRRESAIESLHLEAAAKVTTMVALTESDDPFGAPIDPHAERTPVTDEKEITFSLDGEKRATVLAGYQWNSQLKASKYQTSRVTFDGRESACLFRSGAFSSAMIGQGMQSQLLGYWLIPVKLSIAPGAFLREHGYRLNLPHAQFYKTIYDGQECVEARFPMSAKRKRVGVAYLDASSDYELLAFHEHRDDGTPVLEYAMKYATNSRVGRLISEWTCEYFGEHGVSKAKYEVHLLKALVNEPLDPKIFELEFPIGMEIVEHTEGGGRKHYIQEADGQRRLLSERELKERNERRRLPAGDPAPA